MQKELFTIFIAPKLKKKIKNKIEELEQSSFEFTYKIKENQNCIYWIDATEYEDYFEQVKESFVIVLDDDNFLNDFSSLSRGPYIVSLRDNFESRLLDIITSIYSEVKRYINEKADPALKRSLRRFSEDGQENFIWMNDFIIQLMGNPKEFGQNIERALSITPLEKYWKIERNILDIYDQNLFFLPVYFENNHEYIVPQLSNIHEKKMISDVLAFIYIINEFKISKHDGGSSWGEIDGWEDIFNEITEPLVILSNQGEMINHNKAFLDLSLTPSYCFNLKDGDLVEVIGKSFRVFKRFSSADKKNIYLYFLENPDLNKVEINQDLGIMTSSLAHELNNPLAGILSVINLLELEEDLSEDQELDLLIKEMKIAALRVKKLIQTFLGFSKKEISFQTDDLFNQNQLFSIKEVFEQVKELLRFKMIELNSSFSLVYEKKSSFTHNLNQSMLVMLIYQILSDFVLKSSQEKLITNLSKNSKIKLIEYSDSFEIDFGDEDFQYKKQKLRDYLLKSLNLEINKKGSVMEFRL